jgi:hypothetical protein
VMKAAAKAKQQSFKGQFSKFTIIVNPKFGDEFLDEVSVICLHPTPCWAGLGCVCVYVLLCTSYSSRSLVLQLKHDFNAIAAQLENGYSTTLT